MYSNTRFFGLLLIVQAFFLLSLFLPESDVEIRGMYVNDFKLILGDEDKETEMLTFAKDEGFNYLLLYNLSYIHRNIYDLTDPGSSQVLAQFIKRAKTEFGIIEVGAVGETANSFEVIHGYNELYAETAYSGIDVYNLEFECWNANLVADYYCPTYLEKVGMSCDSDGAFDFYLQQLERIREKAQVYDLKCETYIGTPDQAQCAKIGEVCDRVLVHYYRKSDVYNNGNSIYQFNDYRIPALAPKHGVLDILPIFSARENHMGPWLENNPKEQAYDTYHYGRQGFQDMKGGWKKKINIQGSQWYRYTDLVLY